MERAAPGAQLSAIRNIETADVASSLDDGWIVPADEPTHSSRHDQRLDEAAFDAFDISHESSNLTVTIHPGEAYVNGWIAIDEPTDITVDSNSTTDISIGWKVTAVYDDEVHDAPDDADTVYVRPSDEIPEDDPSTVIWTVTTDDTGVTAVKDERLIGPSSHVSQIQIDEQIIDPQGNVVTDITSFSGTAQALFNDLTREQASVQFELGLEKLDYRAGVYDIYVDETKVETLDDVHIDTDNHTLVLDSDVTDGSASYGADEYDFTPDNAVLSIDGEIPDDASVSVRLVDENGDIVVVEEVDTIVETDELTTFETDVTFEVERDNTSVDSPEIEDFAIYLNGTEPNEYYEGEVVEVTES